MRKLLLNLTLVMALSVMLSSCYVYSYYVGEGPQTGVTVKKKNHYLIYGLAPVNTSDPNELAGGASDFEVTVKHTFVDGLLAAITFGIYTPTTTVVQR